MCYSLYFLPMFCALDIYAVTTYLVTRVNRNVYNSLLKHEQSLAIHFILEQMDKGSEIIYLKDRKKNTNSLILINVSFCQNALTIKNMCIFFVKYK